MSLRAVIVPKISKLSWDMKKYDLSREKIIEKYRDEGVRVKPILDSHKRQEQSLKEICKALPDTPIILDRTGFDCKAAEQFDAVIALGGDNHFLYVARCLEKQVIVGINSDPLSSRGSLLEFTAKDAAYIADCLEKEGFEVESRTRLKVTLNGKPLPYLAASEIFFGETKNIGMSRHFLTYKGIEEEQKHSGLLISTGSGLDGWMGAITAKWPKEIIDCYPLFKKSDPKARLVIRELFKGCTDIGEISGEEEILISSLNDDQGIIALDSDPEDPRFCFPFNRGCQAKITLALDKPLITAVNNRRKN